MDIYYSTNFVSSEMLESIKQELLDPNAPPGSTRQTYESLLHKPFVPETIVGSVIYNSENIQSFNVSPEGEVIPQPAVRTDVNYVTGGSVIGDKDEGWGVMLLSWASDNHQDYKVFVDYEYCR